MFHQVNILSIYSNHPWSKNITISTACLSTHWTAHSQCITSNKLLSCSISLKTRHFSHLAHVAWFACLKWFKTKWVQTIHLYGVSSCICTTRHGSHVSIFSKKWVSPKIHQHGASSWVLNQYDLHGSATSKWYYHYYLLAWKCVSLRSRFNKPFLGARPLKVLFK